MSKYSTYKVRILSLGATYEILAKDSVDARMQAADFYEVEYEDTRVI